MASLILVLLRLVEGLVASLILVLLRLVEGLVASLILVLLRLIEDGLTVAEPDRKVVY